MAAGSHLLCSNVYKTVCWSSYLWRGVHVREAAIDVLYNNSDISAITIGYGNKIVINMVNKRKRIKK